MRPSPNINKVHIDPYSQLFSPDLGAVHIQGKEMWPIKLNEDFERGGGGVY